MGWKDWVRTSAASSYCVVFIMLSLLQGHGVHNGSQRPLQHSADRTEKQRWVADSGWRLSHFSMHPYYVMHMQATKLLITVAALVSKPSCFPYAKKQVAVPAIRPVKPGKPYELCSDVLLYR